MIHGITDTSLFTRLSSLLERVALRTPEAGCASPGSLAKRSALTRRGSEIAHPVFESGDPRSKGEGVLAAPAQAPRRSVDRAGRSGDPEASAGC